MTEDTRLEQAAENFELAWDCISLIAPCPVCHAAKSERCVDLTGRHHRFSPLPRMHFTRIYEARLWLQNRPGSGEGDFREDDISGSG